MKKHTLIVAALMLAANALYAQTNAKLKSDGKRYVRIGLGYGFTHAGQTTVVGGAFNGTANSLSGVAGTSSTQSIKRGSFGTGGSLTLAGGYMLSKNIGVELGVNAIVLPTKYKFTENSSGGGSASTNTYTAGAKLPVYVIPAIMLTTGGNGLNVYARLGLALPVSDKINIKTESATLTGSKSTQYTAEETLTQRFSVGFQGAAGISYPIAKSISLYGEVNGISRNAYAKKLELTSIVQNGVNLISTYKTSSIVNEYEFDVTTNSASFNPNTPTKAVTSSVPYSSIGLCLGARIDL